MSKKITLLIAALFALAACSEDVYQEIDQQNNGLETENDAVSDEGSGGNAPFTFNNGSPGWVHPGTYAINPGTGYHSPWDIWFRNHPYTPSYTFENDPGPAHTSPFRMEVICYVGLAYFDGNNNDGHYRDPYLGNISVANFVTGNFPDLYANNQEAGNLLRTQPIILDGNNLDGTHVTIASDPANPAAGHLPGPSATLHPLAHNGYNQVFDVIGTSDEQALLAEYGKVFYFEVNVIEKATGVPVAGSPFFVQVANETLPGGTLPPYPEWQNLTATLGIQATTPVGLKNIYYYDHQTNTGTVWNPPYPMSPTSNNPNYQCDSHEIVFEYAFSDEEVFSAGTGTSNWKVVAGMKIGSWLWQTSGPYVAVVPN